MTDLVKINGTVFYEEDWSDAKPVSRERRDEWIEEGMKRIKNDPVGTKLYFFSGDSLVLICKAEHGYTIHECKVTRYFWEKTGTPS